MSSLNNIFDSIVYKGDENNKALANIAKYFSSKTALKLIHDK